jgi:hypothetical protein
MLVHYRELSIVKPLQSQPQYITQGTEDSLKLSTLEKLLDSHSYGIQETTARIICDRALHDGNTIDGLLWHITRADHDMREQGIRAFNRMVNSSTVSLINKPRTYAALVKCLEYCITDYAHNDYDEEWDNWFFRDVVEEGCLLVLAHLVAEYGVNGLVKANFVDRWLVKEPWGSTDLERQLNFADHLMRNSGLNVITGPLYRDDSGRKQLEKANLLLERTENPGAAVDTRMINGGSTAGEEDFLDITFIENGRRPRDQSAEEEHLRRRHREAMVLNDGTRPLGRGDIIERER